MYLTNQIHREGTKDGAELTAGGEYGLYLLFDDCVHITAVRRFRKDVYWRPACYIYTGIYINIKPFLASTCQKTLPHRPFSMFWIAIFCCSHSDIRDDSSVLGCATSTDSYRRFGRRAANVFPVDVNRHVLNCYTISRESVLALFWEVDVNVVMDWAGLGAGSDCWLLWILWKTPTSCKKRQSMYQPLKEALWRGLTGCFDRTKVALLYAIPSVVSHWGVSQVNSYVGDVGCTQRTEYLWHNSIRRANEIGVTFLCSLITWFTRVQLIHVTHAHWPNQQECQMARVTSVQSL